MGESKAEQLNVPLLCSYRLLLAMLCCLCFINLFVMRSNMSVAIICMINHTYLEIEEMKSSAPDNNSQPINITIGMTTCANTLSNSTEGYNGEYTWSKEMQGIIHSSFYWGYLATQVAGGVMAERWGAKHVIGWSMFVTMVASVLTPLSSSVSPYLVIAVRVVQGLGQGMVFPAMNSLWGKWAPPLERTKLLGFTYAGASLGSFIALAVSGLLCDLGFAGGWPSIFYVFGLFCFVWFILWMTLVSSSPSQHPYINDAEQEFIGTALGAPSEHPTPWLRMMASPAVWAIIVGQAFTEWGTAAMLTYGPTYMREVLKFDIKQNGVLSALPYLVAWVVTNIASQVADALRVRGWKTATVRKLSMCAGSLLPAMFLVITGHINCDRPYAAVVLLTLGICFCGFQDSGLMANHVDIAPSYAGSLMGIANSFATLSSISAPYIVAILTPKGTQEEWQVVFYVAAAIYTFGAIFYVITVAGEVQSWAMADNHIEPMATGSKESDDIDNGSNYQSTYM